MLVFLQMNAVGLGLAILTALSRLLIDIPNFTPVLSLAIFAGFRFASWRERIVWPLVGLILGDLLLGIGHMEMLFHSTALTVYLAVLLSMWMAYGIERSLSAPFWMKGLVASFFAATSFFILTNTAVWLGATMYPMTMNGYMTCLVMGLPFFDETLTSTGLFLFTFEGLRILARRMQAAFAEQV